MTDWINIVLQLIAGLGVFLYGMNLMSEGFQRVAGDRLKNILAYLIKNRFMGAAVGTLVTAVVQSSSAVTVMVVGFVNAGIMTLTQAISVIMGANIGTTITAQIISFNVLQYAPIFIGCGVFMTLFLSNKRHRILGETILGLGLLFLGLSLMSRGVGPLRHSESTKLFFQHFSRNTFEAILAGLLMTCILQSSSATVALAIVLAQQGLLDFNGAVGLVLGDNIGTTITAQLAAFNVNRNARRAAMAHTMFNVIGVCIFLPFVYKGLFQKFVIMLTPGDPTNPSDIAHFIANSHSLFNIINACLLIGPIKILERISIWLVPIKPEEMIEKPIVLEPNLLDTPAFALTLVRKEMVNMIDISRECLQKGLDAILKKDTTASALTNKLEDKTDEYQRAITAYLIRLAERNLTKEESEQIPTLLHSINDLERVGDNAENLGGIAEDLQVKNLGFSPNALVGLQMISDLVMSMFEPLRKSVKEGDTEAALQVLRIEKEVDALRDKLDEEHLERLKAGVCHLPSAIFFVDALHYLEKIGDHLKNIAQTSYNLFTWSKGKARIKNGVQPHASSPK
ncbi:MAG TPA: Na/Pi cotransporter family protein [Candidatus Sumerlaeota bacterium]|nr:MAG: transcriptional regulator PhoU [candidate division BRC1 bacterium ADurb.Bin183]HOE63832.1 Na/Pi cotransporter family protein [Candidatus Sumerlaeota bacterium]HRR32106.1 Na/Pi cotransporter family protein [Candidatus Sumerlaeia bacterium]HON49936.1 Na/Pi cotransporter family protein [Candidatus Sumerlaeota bacterium]HOR63816.1 Na/Pi cotransporter family protein [Candidatus Sumerlaeota bacterium]